MKFAILEMKLALIKTMLNFEVLRSDKTPAKLEFVQGIVRAPRVGVEVFYKKRTAQKSH